MSDQELFHILKEKYHKLKESVNPETKKYFNLVTFENFIESFKNVNGPYDQRWIFENLRLYLEESLKYIDSADRDIGHKLYLTHLDKVGDYYRSNLGFTLYASFDIILLVFFGILILVKFFFFNWMYSFIFSLSCYILYIVYLNYKKRMKKTFGLFH